MSTFPSSRPPPNPYAAITPTSPSSFSRTYSFNNGPGSTYAAQNTGRSSISGNGVIGGGAGSGARVGSMGGRFKRLLKFTQMDFEVAVWEMTQLMVAPKKVFRNVYYRKQTKNTYTSSDPAFPYLLLFFTFLTSLAWSIAYATPSPLNIIRIALTFTAVHCLLGSLIAAVILYFFVGRALSPGGWLVGMGRPGGALGGLAGRRRGLFGDVAMEGGGRGEELEFGYCFDISIRAFLPIWTYLFALQFLLLPILSHNRFPSVFLSNTLHLLAFAHSVYVTFCGYNVLPLLQGTQVLLVAPLVVGAVVWMVATVGGWNATLALAPVLWAGGGLRGGVGGSHT